MYYVYTWDTDEQAYTPQSGVRCGPHSLYSLRRALQELRRMGYECYRLRDADGGHESNDWAVLVEKGETSYESRCR